MLHWSLKGKFLFFPKKVFQSRNLTEITLKQNEIKYEQQIALEIQIFKKKIFLDVNWLYFEEATYMLHWLIEKKNTSFLPNVTHM